MKTSELKGAALDWAVAKLENEISDDIDDFCLSEKSEFKYSTNWAQGGPIIEREKMDIHWANGCFAARIVNFGNLEMVPKTWFAKTQLIAAMRCFVSSRLGDEIKVPEELL